MDQYATLLHGIVRVSVVFGGMSDERNLPAESQRSNREANRAARVRTFCEMDDLGLTSRYSNRLVFGQRMDFAIRVQGRVIPVDFYHEYIARNHDRHYYRDSPILVCRNVKPNRYS